MHSAGRQYQMIWRLQPCFQVRLVGESQPSWRIFQALLLHEVEHHVLAG